MENKSEVLYQVVISDKAEIYIYEQLTKLEMQKKVFIYLYMEDCQVCIPEEFFTPTNITWAYLISIQHATDESEHLLSFNILSIEKYQYTGADSRKQVQKLEMADAL